VAMLAVEAAMAWRGTRVCTAGRRRVGDCQCVERGRRLASFYRPALG